MWGGLRFPFFRRENHVCVECTGYWGRAKGEIKLGLFESYLGKYLGGGREEEKLGIRNILGEYHREGVAVQLLTEVVGGWLKFT